MRVRLGRGHAWRRRRTSAPLPALCPPSAPALHPLSSRAAAPAPLHLRRSTTPCAPSAGFYVQPGPHAASRLPIALAPGDLIAHSFDMQHGVEVPPAERQAAAPHLHPCSARLQPHTSTPAQPGCNPVCPGYKPVFRTVSGSRLCPPRLHAVCAQAAARCPQPDAPRRAASSSACR